MIYKVIKRLIALGKTEGLADKVAIYHLANQLTDDQYTEIMNLLNSQNE